MIKPAWDDYFLDITDAVAMRASCPRFKVGALLVMHGGHKIISAGYNGAPMKKPECIEVGCQVEDNHCKRTIHAEQNCIYHAEGHAPARDVTGYYAHTMYVTLEPCGECKEYLSKFDHLTIKYRVSQDWYKIYRQLVDKIHEASNYWDKGDLRLQLADHVNEGNFSVTLRNTLFL